MMKKIYFVLLILCVFVQNLSAQTTYKWVGNGASSSWDTPTNWNPVGIPGASDHVEFSTVVTNQPVFNTHYAVANLLLSAAVNINLNGYTLTVNGSATTTAGKFLNGKLSLVNNAGTSFSSTWFDAVVDIARPGSGVVIASCIFTHDVTLDGGRVKLTNNNFAGNNNRITNRTNVTDDVAYAWSANTFGNSTSSESTVTFEGTGGFYMAHPLPNTFNGNLTAINNIAGYLYRSSGPGEHKVTGHLTLINKSTGFISDYGNHSSSYISVGGNLVLDNHSTGGLYVGCTPNGTMSPIGGNITATAAYRQGVLRLWSIQKSAALPTTLVMPLATMIIENCTFNENVTVDGARVKLINSRLFGNSNALTNRTSVADDITFNWSGNTFGNSIFSESTVTFEGTGGFYMAYSSPNTFNGNLTVNNNLLGYLYRTSADGEHKVTGNLVLNNRAGGFISDYSSLANAFISVGGNLVLNNTSTGGLYIGCKPDGLLSPVGGSISTTAAYQAGVLRMWGINNTALLPASLLTQSADLTMINCRFKDNVNLTAGRLKMEKCSLTGMANDLVWTGDATDNNYYISDNTFGTTGSTSQAKIRNIGKGSFHMGWPYANKFNGDLTIENNNSGTIYRTYAQGPHIVTGNLTLVNTSTGHISDYSASGKGFSSTGGNLIMDSRYAGGIYTGTYPATNPVNSWTKSTIGGNIFVSSTYKGELYLWNLNAPAATVPIIVHVPGFDVKLLSCDLNANMDVISKRLYLQDSKFRGANNSFERTISVNDLEDVQQGCEFGSDINSNTTFTYSGSGVWYLEAYKPNIFKGNLTLNNTGTGGIQYIVTLNNNMVVPGNLTMNASAGSVSSNNYNNWTSDQCNCQATVGKDVNLSSSGSGRLYAFSYTRGFLSGNINIRDNATVNAGGITIGEYGGQIILQGTGIQQINNWGAKPAPVFPWLKINKLSGKVELTTEIVVSKEMHFTSGNFTTSGNGVLTFWTQTNMVTPASVLSYVEGRVRKMGNSAFTFPVGKDTYQPLTISAPSSSSDSYTAEYTNQSPPATYLLADDVSSINNCFYWNLVRDAGTSSVQVTLNWPDNCVPSTNDLRIVRWSLSQNKWMNEGVSGLSVPSRTISTAGLQREAGFFTLGIQGVSRPVVDNPAPVCEGSSVTLNATSTVGIVEWYDNPSLAGTANANPFVVTVTQSSMVYYAVTAYNGLRSAPVAVTVRSSSPQFVRQANSDVAVGNIIYLNAGPLNPQANYEYEWTGPNGFTSFSPTPSVPSPANYRHQGTYRVKVTDKDSGCEKTHSFIVVVLYPLPPVVTPNPALVCVGSSVTLQASPAPNNLYNAKVAWYEGSIYSPQLTDRQGVSGNNLTVWSSVETTKTYYAVTTYQNERSAPTMVSVRFMNKPRVTMRASSPVVEGDIIDLTSLVSGVSTANCTFSWTGPNINSPNQQNTTAQALVAGVYTYTLTVNNGGCEETRSIDVVVEEGEDLVWVPVQRIRNSDYMYSTLKPVLDRDYYRTVDQFVVIPKESPNLPFPAGTFLFKYREYYNQNKGGNLRFNIYNWEHRKIGYLSAEKQYGLNWYAIDLRGVCTENEYYVMEVFDDNGHKTVLRFRYAIAEELKGTLTSSTLTPCRNTSVTHTVELSGGVPPYKVTWTVSTHPGSAVTQEIQGNTTSYTVKNIQASYIVSVHVEDACGNTYDESVTVDLNSTCSGSTVKDPVVEQQKTHRLPIIFSIKHLFNKTNPPD